MFMLRTPEEKKKKKTSWMQIFVWIIWKAVLKWKKKKRKVDDPFQIQGGEKSLISAFGQKDSFKNHV